MGDGQALKSNPVGESAGRSYRPDIDGLRAVAVLSVVVYHINKNLMPGGYVGVDIFFVISGYLITRNIWNEIQQRRFSIVNFYVRRIHRIYPAFAVVTMVTLLAGALLLLSADMVRLARSAFWSALAAPNIYFWKYLDTSYFAAASEEEPLLHMWSLGVEEQFYFIWPGLLMIVWLLSRCQRNVAIGLAGAVAILSFAYAEAFLSHAPKFTYYMLPARAGELMIGAILALLPVDQNASSSGPRPWVYELFAVAGMVLILGALILLNDNSRFPGLNAVWPCLGAALMIEAGKGGSWVSRHILTLRPMVFIGLISYSLYLWHWPILAFIRYFRGEVTPLAAFLASAAMLMLAWLSFRFVETPLRHWRPTRTTSMATLWGAPLAVIAIFSLGLLMTDGLRLQIERMEGYVTRDGNMKTAVAPAYSFNYVCQVSVTTHDVLNDPRCKIGAPTSSDPRVLVWGDSKAAQYIGFLDEIGKRHGVSMRNAEHASCPPIYADGWGESHYRESCNRFWKLVQADIQDGRFDVVIIGGSWRAYDAQQGFRDVLEQTLDQLLQSGVQVVLMSDVPRNRGYNRACLERSVRLPWKLDCQAHAGSIVPVLDPIEEHLASLVNTREGRVTFLDFKRLLCPAGECRGSVDGIPLYFDDGHISLEGGRKLGIEVLQSPDAGSWLDALSKK